MLKRNLHRRFSLESAFQCALFYFQVFFLSIIVNIFFFFFFFPKKLLLLDIQFVSVYCILHQTINFEVSSVSAAWFGLLQALNAITQSVEKFLQLFHFFSNVFSSIQCETFPFGMKCNYRIACNLNGNKKMEIVRRMRISWCFSTQSGVCNGEMFFFFLSENISV